MPDLTSQTVKEAERTLESVGLHLGKVATLPDKAQAGTIIKQHPLARTPAKVGDAVEVTVATAPPIDPKPRKVLVPYVREMSLADARKRLEERNLTVGRLEPGKEDEREDVVVEQSPAKDTEVATRSPVDLWFAPRATTPPTTAPTVSPTSVPPSPPPDHLVRPTPSWVYWLLVGVVAALVFLTRMARARGRAVWRHRLRVEATRGRGTSRVECDGEPIDVEVRLTAQRDPGRSQIEVSGPLVLEVRFVPPLQSSGAEPQA